MTRDEAQACTDLLKLRDEALALCQDAGRLAEKVAAVCGERIPDPPVKRRKRHLALVRDAGLT